RIRDAKRKAAASQRFRGYPMSDDRPYRIDNNKIWLSPTAREYAREYFGPGRKGEQQMAKYLLMQNRDVSESEETPAVEGEEAYEALSGEPSENVDPFE